MTYSEALQVLEVKKDNNTKKMWKTIKNAYHRLIKQFHPDKNPNPNAKIKAKDLIEAFRVCKNFIPEEERISNGDEGSEEESKNEEKDSKSDKKDKKNDSKSKFQK